MKENDVFSLLEMSLAAQINQASHALTRIHGVKQNPFESGHHRHGFNHAVCRDAVTTTHIVAVGFHAVATDAAGHTQEFGCFDGQVVDVGFLGFFRSAHANAEYRNLTACAFKSGHQTSLCAGTSGGVHHATDIQAQGIELVDQLQCANHITQCANGVGSTARNDVGLLAFGNQLFGQLGHSGIHVCSAWHFLHVGTIQKIEEYVSRFFVIFYFRTGAIFEQYFALHAHLCCDGHGLACVIRLGSTLRDDGVCTMLDSIGHQKLKLARFVTTRAQASAVVSLDVKIGATQCLRHAGHEFKRCRTMGDANSGEVGDFHLCFLLWFEMDTEPVLFTQQLLSEWKPRRFSRSKHSPRRSTTRAFVNPAIDPKLPLNLEFLACRQGNASARNCW